MTRKGVEVLASKISAHLKRFERDPKINKADPKYKTRPYFHAYAFRSYGPTVSVRYVSYQGVSKLMPDEATAYLKWLDDGNIGTHYKCQREASP